MSHRYFDHSSRNISVTRQTTIEDVLHSVQLCLEAGMQVIVTPVRKDGSGRA